MFEEKDLRAQVEEGDDVPAEGGEEEPAPAEETPSEGEDQ